jgi:RimJ/RimL family protein N-acetyltransferase
MISLRPFTRLDFPRLIGWITSRELMVQWAGPTEFTFPLTETQLEKYLAGAAGERPVRRVYAPITGQGDVCGHIELGAISYENNSASLCRVFVAPEYRGTGICTPMVRQALAIGFDEFGLRRIDLRVYAFNTPGIRCYEKAGFVKEGLLRRSQKFGEQIWDTVVMGILREEWVELNSPQAPAAH